jgi:regulator of protease activity HflC (stomatin/prohibitin superfamily)
MQCISVDLPEPEGPMTAVNLPRSNVTSTPASASTAACPVPYLLRSPAQCAAGAVCLPPDSSSDLDTMTSFPKTDIIMLGYFPNRLMRRRRVEQSESGGLTERPARQLSGWGMAAVTAVLGLAAIALLAAGIAAKIPGATAVGAVLAVACSFLARGLTPVSPGNARVVQVLGRYAGTIREDGLHWVNPVATRRVISTRIRNHETAVAKVNDADGNPIEIAAVVVWQVADTAKAAFGVYDLTRFVSIQTETAVRHVATSYPYDAHDEGRKSLRENAGEITAELTAEIADRVVPAGVKIIESRLTRLAYAPEIAQAMLRRQQASAVVAARQRIVDGAVGMVESALARLSADGIIELDDERRAAMVSNMLVVLCSDHATQPVVNTGTLYQ